jgi:hypothetical protein
MAINKGTTITGYAFPNPPASWSPEEKRFALALRGLFDTLFQKTRGLQTDYDKRNYEELLNKPLISGQVLVGNKSLSDIGIHNVSETDAGLMTSAMYAQFLLLISQLGLLVSQFDYIYMMTQITIDTDTSDKVEKVSGYYEDETWNKGMVWDAVTKWITAEDYEEITGEVFPPYRPEPEEEPDPEEPDPEEEPEPGENE